MDVERNLRRRITEIYRETENMVKIEEEGTEEFWTTRGVWINVCLSDIEENMNKVQEKGIVIGREKVRAIVYADDIVLVATSEVGMKVMLRRVRKYVERKGLTVHTEISKGFRKGQRKRKEKERMEVGRGGTGGGKGDEMSRLHSGEERKSRETHTGKESGSGDEKNVAHWRKVI